MSNGHSDLPPTPYYAVIFTSRLSPDDAGYEAMGNALVKTAELQPGYLGLETARGDDRLGITVSYWKDESSIKAWKEDMNHLAAQRAGMERWYEYYALRVAKVERSYFGPHGRSDI